MATDKQLIEKIQEGKSEVYGQLFRKYYQQIYSICFSILRNSHDAEEVTSETFVHAYLKLFQLKSPDKFSAWLKKIAKNQSKKYVQQNKTESPFELASAQAATQITPEEYLLRQELIDAIMEAIESLPLEDRDVIKARINGLNHLEISEQLGISIEASRSRLYRVRKKITERVKELLNSIIILPKMLSLKKNISEGIKAVRVETSSTGIVTAMSSLMISFMVHITFFITLVSFFPLYKHHATVSPLSKETTELAIFSTEESTLKISPEVSEILPRISFLTKKQVPRSKIIKAKSQIDDNVGKPQFEMKVGVLDRKKVSNISPVVSVERELKVSRDYNLKDGVDELAQNIRRMKLQSKRVNLSSVILSSKILRKSKKLSTIEQVRKANENVLFADNGFMTDKDRNLILNITDFEVPKLPKGEPGGIVAGRGKEIRGYLRFPRVDCSMLDRSIVDRYFSMAIPNLMKWINANTNIKMDMNVEGGGIQLTDANLFDSPVIFFFGYDNMSVQGLISQEGMVGWWKPGSGIPYAKASSRLTDIERKRLREYLLEKGGILVVDTQARINMLSKEEYPWSKKMKRELREILPEYPMIRIPNSHELYRCYYILNGHPPGISISTSLSFAFTRQPYLEGISINGRLAVIYCQEGYAYMMGDFYKPQRPVFRMMTNILVYALTHSGISDKSRYVPEKETQEEIPKKPPFIPPPTPRSFRP